MAWTMIGPPPAVGHADLHESAVTCGSDEHGQALVQVDDAERVAEGMAHVIVADAMLAGARRNISGACRQVTLPSAWPQVILRFTVRPPAPGRVRQDRNAASAMNSERLSAADSARTASRV